ncbi:MAG: hypothetical protein J1F42_13475 [Lachnospiraceae bacterium]|nr:hypothetical protein [Lachnospiraceae bacterium]
MKPEILDTVIEVDDYLSQKNSGLDKEEAWVSEDYQNKCSINAVQISSGMI